MYDSHTYTFDYDSQCYQMTLNEDNMWNKHTITVFTSNRNRNYVRFQLRHVGCTGIGFTNRYLHCKKLVCSFLITSVSIHIIFCHRCARGYRHHYNVRAHPWFSTDVLFLVYLLWTINVPASILKCSSITNELLKYKKTKIIILKHPKRRQIKSFTYKTT